jgi:hypothetical protein
MALISSDAWNGKGLHCDTLYSASIAEPPSHPSFSVLLAALRAGDGPGQPAGLAGPPGLLVKEVITQTSEQVPRKGGRTSAQAKARVANIENIETAVSIYRSSLVLTLTYLDVPDVGGNRPPTHQEASNVFNRVRTGLFDELAITDYFRAREEGELRGRVHDHIVGLSTRDVNFLEGFSWEHWDAYKIRMKRLRWNADKIARQFYEQAVPRGSPMRKVHDALKRAVRNEGRRYRGLGRWLAEPVRPGKEGNLAGYLANYISKAQVRSTEGGVRRPRCYSYGRGFPRAKMLPFAWNTPGARAFKVQKAMMADALGISSNFKGGMRKIFGKRWGKRMIDFATKLVPHEDVGMAFLGIDDWITLQNRLREEGVRCRHGAEEVNGIKREEWNQFVIQEALVVARRAPIERNSAV